MHPGEGPPPPSAEKQVSVADLSLPWLSDDRAYRRGASDVFSARAPPSRAERDNALSCAALASAAEQSPNQAEHRSNPEAWLLSSLVAHYSS